MVNSKFVNRKHFSVSCLTSPTCRTTCEVWKDFSIRIAGFTSSHHIPISFHELRDLPKTNMKSEDSGNVTGFRPKKILGLIVLYRVYICFYLFILGKHHERDNLQSSFSRCFVIFSFFINYSDKEMFIWSKLGQNPSEIDVMTFARIRM